MNYKEVTYCQNAKVRRVAEITINQILQTLKRGKKAYNDQV